MSLVYVIDAYNIINHSAFSRYASGCVKDARLALVDFIKTKRPCGSLKANRAVLVFDGYGDLPPEREGAGVEVIFSQEITADEYIKGLLEASSGNPKNIFVVSDDKEVKSYARLARAGVLGVEEFMAPKLKPRNRSDSDLKVELTYSQVDVINRELRKKWLK